ncbi:RagB/SusD family nutrient uptake outer membrane protein [Flavilitoribacter nigricans]|uniref:RagB/SusD family nutrient uptake outer membrane protein n=1 Tax=Flavilitoribacter nigricans (strain ATCC 23147 / DSM 23189 / NBRC 102662 / NCIMB 1420 / SS-2) TaxID=1122177 RepID=A0A2D0NBP9_FLAN2|nr:RagB/SusD family nutrient uptake outer membrane protein [Flavilitoribacter nigricans]PHN05924.1 RagB/SusD family nutrient uptake outer membrane protein [Flavilitoribacter nigricans DSM 23189 = NBRC 102662]
MKFHLKIAGLLIVSVAVTACTDYLDVKPNSDITSASFWNEAGDAEAYLVGIYDRLRDITNNTVYGEDRADTFDPGYIGPTSEAWAQNLLANNAPSWSGDYNLIYHLNRLLLELERLNFNDQDRKDQILAEAHGIRALQYFRLARVYGGVPIVLNPIESVDVDLVGRSSVDQVFQQINSDIDASLAAFPEAGFEDKNRLSKPAVYALQADVKLWTAKVLKGGTADLDQALTAISQVEASGVTLLPEFSSIFSSDNKKNDEVIFSLYFNRDEQDGHYGLRLATRGDNITQADNFWDFNMSKANRARAVYQPSVKLMSLFKENPGDVREDASIIHAVYTNPDTGTKDTLITVFNKFRGTWWEDNDDRYYDDDLILYRLGDIILLKAEALAAKGEIDAAITELNKTRNRAGIGDYEGPRDQASVEQEILRERWRELNGELKRWWDLIRFHEGGTINIYDEIPNLEGKDGYPLYFPVNQTIIDINPLIDQTPGY